MHEPVRIGLIVPCDLTLDAEYPRYLASPSTVHLTRTGYHEGGLTRAFIEGVASHSEISYAAKSLTKIAPSVISFACTSGSFLNGVEAELEIRQVIANAGAEVAQTTSGALLDAVTALGVETIGIATPYQPEVGDLLADFLERSGIRVIARYHTAERDVITPISSSLVRDMALRAAAGNPDAVFLACTGVPTIEHVGPLEHELGLPVLTANQVTMWAAAGAARAEVAPLDHLLLKHEWKAST